jgi:hypothetical protein
VAVAARLRALAREGSCPFAAGPACTSSSRASNPVAACGPKLRPTAAAAARARCRAIGRHAALRSAARVSAALRPIEGAGQIARYIYITSRAPSSMTILERTVNGQPGLVAQQDGVTVTVFAFDVAGDRITHIWAVRNPGKLRPWTARWPGGTWAFLSVATLVRYTGPSGGHPDLPWP